MHSRILIIEPKKDNHIDCDSIYEEMASYGNSVDYVIDSESKFEDDFKWFMDYVRNIGFKESADSKGFIIEDKDLFWLEMQNDVEEYIEMGIKDNRWRIEDRVGMKSGFWIYYQGSLYTMPYFMEYIVIKNNMEFKINSFLDYHY